MGVRSDVGLAVKAELIEELREKHPWVFEEADEELFHVEGRLFIFRNIKWYPFLGGKVAELCNWLEDKDVELENENVEGKASAYLLVEACYEEPDPTGSSTLGEWEDNPWELRKALTVELRYQEV